MRAVLAYVATILVIVIADYLWLGFVTKDFVRAQVGTLLLDTPRWIAAVLFYVVYVMGVLYFVVMPAMADGSVITATLRGALFGLFCYATYDLTNFATLKAWTPALTLVDIAWGSVMTAVAASAGTWAGLRVG
jgi:uncharacterized membrane protein